MSRPLTYAALALLVAGGLVLAFAERAPESVSGGKAPTENAVDNERFLADLDPEAGPYAVLLHPLATGDGLRIVRDQDAIRAARTSASYEDHLDEQTAVLLASIFFLSPPNSAISAPFVTVVRDRDVLRTHMCYIKRCAAPDHTRNLAGLLDASEPAEQVTEEFAHPAIAHTALFKAMQREDIPIILPVDLPAPNSLTYPHRFRIGLPAFLAETRADDPHEALVPFDEAAYMARLNAAFAHLFPDAEAYRFGRLSYGRIYPSMTGFPIVSGELDGPLRTQDDRPRGLTGVMVYDPFITVEVIPDVAAQLTGPAPFAEMPAFSPPVSARIQATLDAMAEEVLGRPCAGCFDIEASVQGDGSLSVREIAPVTYSFSYYKVLSDEPSAQQ